MKKFKVILALALVTSLFVAMFAACTQNSSNGSDSTPPAQDNTDHTDTPGICDPEDYVHLNMYYLDLRNTGTDHGERISSAINEYIGPTYGLQLNINWLSIGEWIKKVQLAISGGEVIDVLHLAAGNTITVLHPSNMLMDITDLLQEYAPETMELMADYLESYSYSGRIYGVPTYRSYCKNGYFIMRKDILDELGLTEFAQNMTSLTEYEQILSAVAEHYTAEQGIYALSRGASKSTMYAYLWNGDQFSDLYWYDGLGDTTSQIMMSEDDQALWLTDDPRFEQKLQRIATWRENGWIYPDSALIDVHGDDLLEQGVTFSIIDGSEYGVETVKSASCGRELICTMYYQGAIDASNLNGWGVGVPITSEEPEAACVMINALYTDEYLMNLLTRGEEGIDYTIEDDQIVYPVGTDYYYEADFLIGYNLLLKPLMGQGADYYQEIERLNQEATVSKYLGFLIENSEIEIYLSNLTSVSDQYRADLYCGGYTPELFAEYKQKLETAGVHEYIAAIQTQVDAWLTK